MRGCQNCFRSLEPASSITCRERVNRSENENSQGPSIPKSQLWPVQEYSENDWKANKIFTNSSQCDTKVETELRTGRVRCIKCCSLFCSKSCFVAHAEEMGSCCICASVIQAMVHNTCCHARGDDECNESRDLLYCPEIDIHPSLVLAGRMFCAAVHRHRMQKKETVDEGQGNPHHGMCGEAKDLTPLELGVLTRSNTPKRGNTDINRKAAENIMHEYYSLDTAYLAICGELDLTPEEQQSTLTLEFLHTQACVAARNSFCITTQSPFRPYYSALLRESGGRQTTHHKEFVKELSLVLGSENETLERGMDKQVENQVSHCFLTVKLRTIALLFTSLFPSLFLPPSYSYSFSVQFR